ncbi:MAG: hypothetical protein LKJ05_01055 [Bifidobacteriaceae bacterium]|jgi:uncharacterized membrane protein|nr:hypothetical protein [Bifidobacteriaceae bacterium]
MKKYQNWILLIVFFLITVGSDLVDAYRGQFNLASVTFAIHVIAIVAFIIYAWVWPRVKKSKNSNKAS